ncbi:hypothetical protein DXG03_000283 [Asterophora parasitica]|uniref:Uncharacterized protein n=1 Tax=Asterophora parasitica TaxID=117018 RepID=A0A9P7GFZ0_9AGAR|nr:hypothetical protein DXG03_000283 [Asterophora parasitica]
MAAALSLLSQILSPKRLTAQAAAFSLSRFWKTAHADLLMPIPYPDEVVDDSEPEREELRRREKPSRNYNIATTVVKRTRNPIDIIEITDDESDAVADHLPSVIEIATQSIFPPPAEKPKALLNGSILVSGTYATFPGSRKSNSVCLGTPLSRSLPISSTSLIPPEASEDPHLEDEDDAKINFARFAYVGSTSSVKPPANKPGPGLSRRGSGVNSTIASKAPPKMKPAHRFADDFSDVELSMLSKCVGCEVHWTARKTVAQKMLHVQACAKKKYLDDATVRILIRKEIDSAMAIAAPMKSKGEGKGKADEAVSGPRTFLEEVVAEAAPRRKGRRLDTRETVQSVAQTRDLILDRARAVIGTTFPLSEDQNISVRTQAVGPYRLGLGSSMLPSTQAFGASGLAQQHLAATTLLGFGPQLVDNELSDAEMPATQPFAPSRLGPAPRGLYIGNDDGDADMPGTQSLTPSTLSDAARRPFHIGDEESDAEVPPATQSFASSKLGSTRIPPLDSGSRAALGSSAQSTVLSWPVLSYTNRTNRQSASPANVRGSFHSCGIS